MSPTAELTESTEVVMSKLSKTSAKKVAMSMSTVTYAEL